MTTQAVVLIIVSAFLHAGWNLLVKKCHPSPSLFLFANTLGVLFFSPLLLFLKNHLFLIPPQIYLLLIATGFFMALYLFNLAQAYTLGTMSVIYPTIRALPIILVTLTLAIFKGESFSSIYLFGALLIIIGLYLNWGSIDKREFITNLFSPAGKYVFLAAIGTAGYSLVDAEGVTIMNKLAPFSAITAPSTYIILQGFSASLWLLVLIVTKPSERRKIRVVLKNEKITAILVGVGMYATYGLVLASMLFADNVGYIVAFRQLSIPLGAFLGWFILKDNFNSLKLVGTIILVAGLIMVALG